MQRGCNVFATSKYPASEDDVYSCYADESGTGSEPIATMAGIIIDLQRRRQTAQDWAELLDTLSGRVGHPIHELHAAAFYPGNGIWRIFDGPERAGVIQDILDWIRTRKHKAVYSAVMKSSFAKSRNAGRILSGIDTYWRLLAFHLTLAVQKCHQTKPENKGCTYMLFDHAGSEERPFIKLVKDPPAWSDSYYIPKTRVRLDQVLDTTPIFVDSKDHQFLQVADFLAFLLRRYAEVEGGVGRSPYSGEREKLRGWVRQVRECSLGSSYIYLRKGRTEAHDLFYDHAPAAIREIHNL